MPDSHIQPPPAIASRLRDAFTAARIDQSVLRDAVREYVESMKPLGASVERVIVDVKRVAEIEGGPLYRAAMRKDAEAQREAKRILDQAVKWTIDWYFSGAQRPTS